MIVMTRCVWSVMIVGLVWLLGWGAGGATANAAGAGATAVAAVPDPVADDPVADDPVQRFLTSPAEPLTSYRALRKLSASNPRFKKEGWITAWTELDPQHGFRYEIAGEGGSEYIRRKVLHKLLDGERDAVASGQPARVALSPLNYRFGVVGDDGGVMRLSIVPLRPDVLLVKGTITAESSTGDLLSVEGRLSKNPSFWTSRVDISRRYGRVAGIRVPIEVVSTAHVKIAGASTLVMTYEYESINGRAVKAAAEVSARHMIGR
jgi:hypothetical protein